jgi:hypothetical protein
MMGAGEVGLHSEHFSIRRRQLHIIITFDEMRSWISSDCQFLKTTFDCATCTYL